MAAFGNKRQNILATLNILVLVFRAQKNKRLNLDEKEQYILQITKEHVAKSGLNIPLFINSLKELAGKDCLLAANSVFVDKYHEEILKVVSD